MANPENYKIFVHWYKTMDWILDKCEKMPVNTRFTISNRMGALCVENIELLVEAIYRSNRRAYLESFNMNLEKLRVFFRICHERRYISHEQYRYIATEINEAGKMCGGWLKSCAQ